VIRPARPEELAELIEVERAADQLFPLAGYGTVPPPATLAELRAAPGLLVSGDPPAGYARIEVVDGRAHLEGLSVRPRFMRQGRGTELVLAACRWAAVHGFDELTLCTFAEVPWNGPFYARLGFVELAELTPGLRALREAERALGLDAMGRRVVLIRSLGEQLSGPAAYLPGS
jgi:GNAT superfamily N-acetyltransferase